MFYLYLHLLHNQSVSYKKISDVDANRIYSWWGFWINGYLLINHLDSLELNNYRNERHTFLICIKKHNAWCVLLRSINYHKWDTPQWDTGMYNVHTSSSFHWIVCYYLVVNVCKWLYTFNEVILWIKGKIFILLHFLV